MSKACQSPGVIELWALQSWRDFSRLRSRMASIPTRSMARLTCPMPFANKRVEYVREEPPGIPTAFWRGVGPTHNVYVIESFIDELAAIAKKDPVDYRRAMLGNNPRALHVLNRAAEIAGWGKPLADRRGRGVCVHNTFGSFMSQVAEVTVSKSGEVHVDRVVCVVDTGVAVNPDTIVAQMQSGIIFGITAALWGEITLKNGRVEQSNFNDYKMLRINEAPIIEVEVVKSSADPGGIGEPGTTITGARRAERGLCRNRRAAAQAADQLGAAKGIRETQMRALPVSLGVGAMIVVLGVGLSSARPEAASTLRPATEFSTIGDDKARAVALFNEAGKVILNPRCVNCHPAGDRPSQGDDGHPHQPLVVRGMGGLWRDRHALHHVPRTREFRSGPRTRTSALAPSAH